MRSVPVFLGLGASLGERRANIEHAIERLAGVPGVEVLEVSDLVETDPVGGGPQGRYLNGVAKLMVSLPAGALMQVCKQLELAAGRDAQAPRNSPRPLDLDLLLYGDETIDTRELQVPHPRMWERDFVLQPLAQLVDIEGLTRPERPVVIRESEAFAALNNRWLRGGCRTGLVPTMGALHTGHASLLRAARLECDRVAATIFVNPLQFGANEDLSSYPRTFESDLAVLREERIDAVFVPPRSAMYPDGFDSRVHVGPEVQSLEGAARPRHFEGVATVVAKLFNLARPNRAYFGQKDAQQVSVIRQMVQDLDYNLMLRVCPIVREPDGLAVSSRNSYLSAADRAAAAVLYTGLCAAQNRHAAGERDAAALVTAAREVIGTESAVVLDYLELRTEGSLEPLPPGPVTSGRLLVAARVGDPDDPSRAPTRLIDNLSLGPDQDPPELA